MAEEKLEKHPGGAPTKLTKKVILTITNYLRGGAYVETAVAACGIPKQTFYRWLKKGANQTKGLCRELSYAVEAAMAQGELRDLSSIDKAATGNKAEFLYEKDEHGIERLVRDDQGNPILVRHAVKMDWRAAAWRLERRNGKRWSPRQTFEHTGPDGSALPNYSNLTDEELQRKIDDLIVLSKKDDDGTVA